MHFSTILNDIKEVRCKLRIKFEPSYEDDMLVFDAILCNADRHFENFGFLVDTKTNRIAVPAPLFDHGNSLFDFAERVDLESINTLLHYAKTLHPCVYNGFRETAQSVLTPRHKEMLRDLFDFRILLHTHYDLPRRPLETHRKSDPAKGKKIAQNVITEKKVHLGCC